MIALDPATRPTFEAALETYRGSVFPESFYSFLHEYVASVNEITNPSIFDSKPSQAPNASEAPPATSAALPATGTTSTLPTTPAAVTGAMNVDNPSYESMLPNESDSRIDRLWNEFAMLEPHLIVAANDDEMEKRPDRATARTRATPFQVCDHKK
jgi:phosphoinositide-3-kinase regulatory subunit 4